MPALYNEIEPFAVDWLRNLSTAGAIAHGDVDGRSIAELVGSDFAGREQAHFFAGIGVWSYALRRAGLPDTFPVWTGSCPCQPFSNAGKRGGFDDVRHLWPEWFRLIKECRPPIVFGEQVASPDGLEWLDLVFADLESAGYAVAAVDLCAAGVGAPHIRQRLWFVAYAIDQRRDGFDAQLSQWRSDKARSQVAGCGASDGAGSVAGEVGSVGALGLGHAGLDRDRQHAGELHRDEAQDGTHSAHAPVDASTARGVADTDERTAIDMRDTGNVERTLGEPSFSSSRDSGETRGFWADAEWIPCRDGKARPIEPGTFPVVDGAPARDACVPTETPSTPRPRRRSSKARSTP